jgi:hypothetical protein
MPDSPLQILARRIAQTRPIDRSGKQALARELKNLRSRLYPATSQDLVDRVEATALLMHFLSQVEDSPIETLQLVARLTASFDERCFAPPSVEASAAARPTGVLEGLSSTSKLGEIMVAMGIIAADQLEEALRIQKSWRLPLGTCLEKLGHATPAQVTRALDMQKKLRVSAEPPAPLGAAPASISLSTRGPGLPLDVRGGTVQTLGDFLLQRNMLTSQQLERAVTMQRAAGITLNEALVQLGLMTVDQVRQAVQMQEKMRGRA